ncbi:MAG: hypothetical protein RIC55_02690 [Pirellulaceae bacterium]
MRLRRYVLVLLGLALLALAAVWQLGYDGADPRLIFWPRPTEPGEPAALDRLVSINVEDRPLRDVLQDFSDEHDLPIRIDHAALKNSGIASNVRVSLRAEGITLRTALELLAEQGDPRLELFSHNGELWLSESTYWKSVVGHYESRLHRLDGLLTVEGPITEDDVAQIVCETVEPGNWIEVGGLGECHVGPGALLIVQTDEAHRRIEALLAGLEQMLREPRRRRPLDLDLPESSRAGREKILTALAKPTSLKLVDVRLDDALDDLAARHDIPIVVDRASLQLRWGTIDTRQTVTHDLQAVRLDTALRVLLTPFGLTHEVRGEALVTSAKHGGQSPLFTRLYPVADLLRIDPGRSDALLVVLHRAVASSSWSGVGGTATYAIQSDILVVRQTEANHARLVRLLADLRRANGLDVNSSTSPWEDAAGVVSTAQLLDKPTSLDWNEMPLGRVVRILQQEHRLPVTLDEGELRAVGVDANTPFTISAVDAPLSTALTWMLKPRDMAFTIVDDAVLITTTDEANDNEQARCYGVRRLTPTGDFDSLINVITTSVSPDSWPDVGGPSTVEYYGDALVVPQSREADREIAALLAGLESRLDQPDALKPIDVLPEPSQLARRVLEQLDKPAELELGQTSLANAVRRITAKYGVPVQVEYDSLIHHHVYGDTPTEGEFSRMRLGSALSLLARSLPAGVGISVRDSAVYFSDHRRAEENRLLRLYPTRGLVDNDVDAARLLGDFGERLVEQDEWHETGEFGDLLVVGTTWEKHQQWERLVMAIRRMQADPTIDALTPDAPPGSAEARLLATLEKPVDLDVQGRRLRDVLEQVAREHDMPLWFDESILSAMRRDLDAVVTFSLHGATLGRALELLLAEHELAYGLRHESLIITASHAPGYGPSIQPMLRLYQIGDLRRRYPPLKLEEPPLSSIGKQLPLYDSGFLTDFTEPSESPSFSRRLLQAVAMASPGAAVAVYDNLLGVYGAPASHRTVQAILSDMRVAIDLEVRGAEQSLLDRKVSLHCDDVPLPQAVEQLSREQQLPIRISYEMLAPERYPLGGPFSNTPSLRGETPSGGPPVVNCDLRNVTLREAIVSLGDAEFPLVPVEDHGLVIVTSPQRAEANPVARAHRLDHVLACYCELDIDSLARMAELMTRDSPFQRMMIAPCGESLVVLHTLQGHEDLRRWLTMLVEQADRAPRPYQLQRDDNTEAQQQLAERVMKAEDSLEAAWLAALATTVDYPTAALTEALAKRWMLANDDHDTRLCSALSRALKHGRYGPHREVPPLLAAFNDDDNALARYRLLVELREKGTDGVAELGGLLQAGEELSPDDRNAVLRLLAIRPEGADPAVPAIVEWLDDAESADQAVAALRAIDPEGRTARAYVEKNLANPQLPIPRRERLEKLRQKLDALFKPPTP